MSSILVGVDIGLTNILTTQEDDRRGGHSIRTVSPDRSKTSFPIDRGKSQHTRETWLSVWTIEEWWGWEGVGFLYEKQERQSKLPDGFSVPKVCHTAAANSGCICLRASMCTYIIIAHLLTPSENLKNELVFNNIFIRLQPVTPSFHI